MRKICVNDKYPQMQESRSMQGKRDQEEAVKSCMRRSVIYQTWCHTCRCRLKRELEEKYVKEMIEERNNDRKRKRESKRKKENSEEIKKRIEKEVEEKTYRYIGETSRSAYERAREHLRDLREMDTGSHLLKHIIQKHMENPKEVEFRMKILSNHYTAFSRQISEAVKINRNKGPFLLNSKSEYNRSSLPSIKTSEKKSPWELSDMEDTEIKEAIKILKTKTKDKKLECMMHLVEEKKEKNEGIENGIVEIVEEDEKQPRKITQNMK